MKKKHKKLSALLVAVFSLLIITNSKAQTTLYAGDLAFVGAQCTSGQADTFVVVLLKDIAANTEIGFTDGCWQDTSSKFFIKDTHVDWVFFWKATSNMYAGDTISFYTASTADNNEGGPAYVSQGTATGGCGLNLKNLGDQIFAFQGVDAIDTTTFTYTDYYVDPTRVLAGIHLNVNFATTDANWDNGTYGLQQSELPDSLTTGSTAIRLYTGTTTEVIDGYLSSHILSLDKSVINNLDNWTRANTTYSPAIPVRLTWTGSWNGTTSSTVPAVINSSSVVASFSAQDIRINNGYALTLNAGNAVNCYGDLYNYGSMTANAASAEFRFMNTTDTADIYGNAMAWEGVSRVGTSAVLRTNDLLTLGASAASKYGQLMGGGSYTGTVIGNVTASYYIGGSTAGWRSICSPLSGATLAQINDDIPLNFGTPNANYTNVFRFNEGGSSPHWTAATSLTQTMDSGAYAVYIRSASLPITLDITGTYYGNTDYTEHGLTLTGSVNDTSGWHLIRNPWPSGYYWDGSVSNIQGNAVYVYDASGGTYTSFDNIFDGILPPFTAFTVKVSSNNVDVTLANTSRNPAVATNYFDKTGLFDNLVSLTVKNKKTDVTDVVRFYTEDDAKNDFDVLDGVKKMNDAAAPSIYFTNNGTKLYKEAWQNIPNEGADLPLSLSTTSDGEYQITVDMQNIELGTEFYLEDLQDKKLYDISKGSVNFMVNPNDKAERFILHIRKRNTATGVEDIAANEYFIGSNSTTISIGATQTETVTVEVVDLLGKALTVSSLETQAGQVALLPALDVAPGYYIVKVNGNSGMKIAKVYLK